MDCDAVTFVVFLELPAFHLEAYDFFPQISWCSFIFLELGHSHLRIHYCTTEQQHDTASISNLFQEGSLIICLFIYKKWEKEKS